MSRPTTRLAQTPMVYAASAAAMMLLTLRGMRCSLRSRRSDAPAERRLTSDTGSSHAARTALPKARPPVRATAYLAHPIYFIPLTVTAANPAAAIAAFNAGRSLASSASKRAV